MKRTIYHGSQNIISQPIYGYGKSYNDYGLGFYCTDSIEMGLALAKKGYKEQVAGAFACKHCKRAENPAKEGEVT